MQKGETACEENILLLLSQGDEQAFAWIYEKTYPSLYYYVKRFVEEEQARDIVADCYIKLLRAPKKFDHLAHCSAYIKAIARNACIDLLQRRNREIHTLQQLALLQNEQQEVTNQHYELEALVYKKILDEIEQLPAFTKKIFKLSYLEGLNNTEIGALLNIRDQTVRNKKAEALKKLRLKLAEMSRFLHLLKFFLKF